MPCIEERLLSVHDQSNREDLFSVMIKKSAELVRHVLRMVLCICSLFLRQSGSLACEVTGNRRRSVNLLQGSLELPCLFPSPVLKNSC